ncbi:hypothetical protein ACTIVE_4505 [Actinomadura verrucosospora]|uniref:Uncharacterized protein n=1 Tax=Actinomadura verrucosospora TaxID=46165 RepID=A0A7D4A0R6_ACTVE|nr:hypothetical protein ACTIVE_4505 [Actinomadura verrucosospora]
MVGLVLNLIPLLRVTRAKRI